MEYSAIPGTKAPEVSATAELEKILALIQKGKRFLVVSHERPDGDAVGSASGLFRSLRKMGKAADVSFSTPIPGNFQFLLENELTAPDSLQGELYDGVFALDTGDCPRTGFQPFLEKLQVPVVNIDHHPSNTRYGKINYLDFGASCTCELIFNLIKFAGMPLDSEIAEGLYLGLLTDSRFFQNERIRPAAHQTAGELLSTGLDTGRILSHLNRQRVLPELRILGRGLEKLQTSNQGKLATIILTRDDYIACGAQLEHTWSCGLFGQMMSIKGIRIGVCLMENLEGKCFCEFRSVGGVDVKEIAVSMGGGGHLAASGCNRIGVFSDFVREILEKVESKVQSIQSEDAQAQ